MSRTRRRDPGGFWMRFRIHHRRAKREIERADDAIRAEGLNPRPRRAIPVNPWDDLLVSEYRGAGLGKAMKREKFPVWIDGATFQALMALKRPDGSRMFAWGLEPMDAENKPRTSKAKKSR